MTTVPHKHQLSVALLIDTVAWAGTERHMLDLARGLHNEGVKVCIACPSAAALAHHAGAKGLKVHAIERQSMLGMNAIRTLRRLLRSGAIDIIHAHNGRTKLIASVSTQLAGRGICIATQHFLEPAHLAQHGLKAKFSHYAHRMVNARTNHFIAISQAVQDEMLARDEAPSQKISVVHNGIGLPDINSVLPRERSRANLHIDVGSPLIVCVARLEREKGVDDLVTAMSLVKKAHPNVRCVIAGEGSHKQLIEGRIRQLGLTQQVNLLGFVSDAMSLMNAADIFVLPSPAEPFGLVLLEAMALGKPVIATRAGGPLEIVVEGKTGLLVPPTNPQMLAEAITCLLRDGSKRQEMGKQGQARLYENFTAQRMAQATLAVYQHVTNVV